MKKLILILSLIAIVITIPVSVVLVKKRQELRSKAAPATVLSLAPATATWASRQEFTVNVNANTGENTIVSVDLVLSFNPQILEATSVSLGSFLTQATEIQKIINNQAGRIIYSFYTMTTNAKSGQGTLAVITFKGKTSGTSPVSFDSQTAVGALQEGQNVLSNTVPGSYTITGGITPPPTPTLTPTPTPSPSPSPSVSPSPTPRTSPTPSPAPGATPTPTPPGQGGPISTPTPTPAATITSATTISSPPSGATVTTAKPTISGKTVPWASVTIVINSPIITATVNADSSGNWSYTPASALADGSHTVTITAKDPTTGQTVSKTSSFVIAAGASQSATTAGEVVAGSPLPTILSLGAGLLLMALSLTPWLTKLTTK